MTPPLTPPLTPTRSRVHSRALAGRPARVLIAALVLLAASTAVVSAAGLPDAGHIVLTDNSGAVVGSGELGSGSLQLELLRGTAGFVTLTVTDAVGGTTAFDGLVTPGGGLRLTVDGQIVSVSDFAARNQLRLELTQREQVSAPDGSTGMPGTSMDDDGGAGDTSADDDGAGDTSADDGSADDASAGGGSAGGATAGDSSGGDHAGGAEVEDHGSSGSGTAAGSAGDDDGGTQTGDDGSDDGSDGSSPGGASDD